MAAPEAEFTSESESAVEPEAAAEAAPFVLGGDLWSEPGSAVETHEPRVEAAGETDSSAEDVTEFAAEPDDAVAAGEPAAGATPEPVVVEPVDAADTPTHPSVVLRIELALVDNQLRIVSPTHGSATVDDVNLATEVVDAGLNEPAVEQDHVEETATVEAPSEPVWETKAWEGSAWDIPVEDESQPEPVVDDQPAAAVVATAMPEAVDAPAVPPETEGPPPWAFAPALASAAEPAFEAPAPAEPEPVAPAPVFEHTSVPQPAEPMFAAPVDVPTQQPLAPIAPPPADPAPFAPAAQVATSAITDDDLPPPWGTAVVPHAPAAAVDPMAAFAPAVAAPAAPALAPIPDPAFAPPAPVEQPQPAAPASVSQASATEQNDLWFLSTEPQETGDAVDGQGVATANRPSSMLTAALTIGMAILVIVLVLVFIQLMTSILR
jgi:hypothetical protein